MDLITRANWKEMEVEEEMCDALRELFADELEREKEKGIRLAKLVFRLSAEGKTEEEIAGECGMSEEQVREILE